MAQDSSTNLMNRTDKAITLYHHRRLWAPAAGPVTTAATFWRENMPPPQKKKLKRGGSGRIWCDSATLLYDRCRFVMEKIWKNGKHQSSSSLGSLRCAKGWPHPWEAYETETAFKLLCLQSCRFANFLSLQHYSIIIKGSTTIKTYQNHSTKIPRCSNPIVLADCFCQRRQ